MTALADDVDGAAVSGGDGFGDGQAHAGSVDEVALIFAAIELIEDEAQLHFLNAGAVIGDAGDQSVAGHFGGDGDGTVFGRVGVGVFDEASEDVLDAIEVDADGRKRWIDIYLDGPGAEEIFALGESGSNDVGHGGRLEVQFEFAGVEASHFGGVTNELIQPIAFFVDDGEKFAGPSVMRFKTGFRSGKQAGDGDLDGSKGSAEVVGNGVEKGGFELFAFASSLGFTQVFDGAGAFDGDGDHGGEGFERFGGEQAAGNAQTADGAGAHADGNEREAATGVAERLAAEHGEF